MKKATASILLTSLFILSPMTHARPGGGHGGMKKILKQLDLSDEQKEQLKKMRSEGEKDRGAHKGKMKEYRDKMKSLFASDASESELRSLKSEMKKVRSEKGEKRFNRLMKIRNILTVEQRKKFQELRKQNKKGRRFDSE